MKLLLHICCAPCEIYPLERLKAGGYEVVGFFYNPNIHPCAEYEKRKKAVEDFSSAAGVDIIFAEYRPEEFFQAVNQMEERIRRCPICWYQRLKRTGELARQKGFDSFSSTLLVSPFQDQDSLKEIGENISQETGVAFYYQDFRPGFKEAHKKAKGKGIYCQNYCGCIYSEIERCRRSVRS